MEKKPLSVQVRWLGNNPNFTASYEDRPFEQNVRGHMFATNLIVSESAEKIMFICPPCKQQGEASLPRQAPAQDYTDEELSAFAKEIAAQKSLGKHCYLLDVDFANGGNPALLKALAKQMPLTQLWGYSGWNTASNALGTLLAQILASETKNSQSNQWFTAERILDDCIYQSTVRQVVTAVLKQKGIDIYNIEDVPATEKLLAQKFEEQAPLLEALFGQNKPQILAGLRWPRLFEAAVFVKQNGGPVFQ